MRNWILAGAVAIAAVATTGTAHAASATEGSQQAATVTNDSINTVITQANAGDARAQNILATWLYTGQFKDKLPQDYNKAAVLWARSAKQNFPLAIGNLGLCYQFGNGVEADSLKAVKLYERSLKKGNEALLHQQEKIANGGNVFSAIFVGHCYQDGVGTGRDTDKAIHYYTIAAEKNSVPAQLRLALLMRNSAKPAEAAKWFKRAMENGNINATYMYGKMMLDGTGIQRDAEQGFNYILRAAQAGFPMAEYQAGICYETGNGVTQNDENAAMWTQRAAAGGLGAAQWAAAQNCINGKGVDVNYPQALYWLSEAVAQKYNRQFEKKFAPGQEDTWLDTPFGTYLQGMDTYLNDHDYEKAISTFKTFGKSKMPLAKTMEAIVMADKENPKANPKKAIKLLKDAAKTDALAQFTLGKMLESGEGTEKDMKEAVALITKAAEAGMPEAQCYLGDMYYEGRGVAQDYTQAVALYKQALSQSQLSQVSAKRLAECYDNAWGGLQTDKEAAKALREANYTDYIPATLKLIP